jgi:uncharacterized OB-fold protein
MTTSEANPISTLPTVRPSSTTEPFWLAAGENRLAVQRCPSCRQLRFPPSPECLGCGESAVEWVTLSGSGVIKQTAIMREQRVKGFTVPYVAIMVELSEQPGLVIISNLIGTSPEQVRIGMRVHAFFEPIGGGSDLSYGVPLFRAVDPAGQVG